MANTFPVADTAGVVEQVGGSARSTATATSSPSAPLPSAWRARARRLGAMADCAAGVRVFSDDGNCVDDAVLMRRALEYVKAFDGVVAQHAQEPRLTQGAQMNEGAISVVLGLGAWPPSPRRRYRRNVLPGDACREQAVAGDDRLLGDRGPAAQAELRRTPRPRSSARLRSAAVPRVLGDHAVEGLHVLERAAHEHRVGHAVAVVGEHPHSAGRVGHRAEFGEPLALEPDRDGADGRRRIAGLRGRAARPARRRRRCRRRGRCSAIAYTAVKPPRRRPGTGLDGLGVLPAGLAQMGVEVDQAGQQRSARRPSTTVGAGGAQAAARSRRCGRRDQEVAGPSPPRGLSRRESVIELTLFVLLGTRVGDCRFVAASSR